MPNKKALGIAVAAAMAALLVNCGGGGGSNSGSGSGPMPSATGTPAPTLSQTEDALRAHIQVLASDDYGGRMPGTEGGRLTQSYIEDRLIEYGLEPAISTSSGMSFRQNVPLQGLEPTDLEVRAGGAIVSRDDAYIVRSPAGRLVFGDLPLVAIDSTGDIPSNMSGSIAVVLGNSNYPTLYQRALAANAASVIVAFTDANRFAGIEIAIGRTRLLLDDGSSFGSDSLVFLGPTSTAELFNALGLTQSTFSTATSPIGTGAVTTEMRFYRTESANVVGRLPGSSSSAGAIMVMGHWDHLGGCGRSTNTDRICNGAVDNASGIAAMLETIKRIAEGPDLARDVYFFATTAEESGLLGAVHFVRNSPVSLGSLRAVLNLDTVAIADANQDISVIGWNRTPLDTSITQAAQQNGRQIRVGSESEDLLRRQDGWIFLNSGVPAVLVSSAFAGGQGIDAYFSSRYHRANDELDSINLSGVASDIPVYETLLRIWGDPGQLAASPGWEFDDTTVAASADTDPLFHVH